MTGPLDAAGEEGATPPPRSTARLLVRGALIGAAGFFLISLLLPCKLVNVRGGWSIGLESAPIFETVMVYQVRTWPAVAVSAFLVLASVPLRGWPAVGTLLLGSGAAAIHAMAFRFAGSFVLGSADRVLYGYHVHLWACYAAVAACAAVLAAEIVGMQRRQRRQPR